MLSVSQLVTTAGQVPDFDLKPGCCLAVTGPSGTGKSLMLRAIADLDPAQGQISLDGRPCESFAAPDWRRDIRYLAAEAAFWEPTLGAHFSVPPTADDLAAVGLRPDRLDAPILQLSSGERQRGALLRAMEDAPRVLLLDEPTSSLDAASTALVEALLKAFLSSGGAIVLVTHDEDQAERLRTSRLRLHR
ncbi:ABC transporter ATP-binding protein [Salipiger mangrovisoli]|uniref:ATP-binding cassette domain-containing protein n=1 Tax=Salipiger mangrovisoli TaxID=2865933 RepID=A0ABR9WY67_9RHOB|nr:ABC transporter ATP-binding protein [Salipiger mangrovisoli]MBE9636219.1 ATP-binding cassette domain-containing protein [Salipiger mangrovisoli]